MKTLHANVIEQLNAALKTLLAWEEEPDVINAARKLRDEIKAFIEVVKQNPMDPEDDVPKYWTAKEVIEAMRNGTPIDDNDFVNVALTANGETHHNCCTVAFFKIMVGEIMVGDTQGRG